CSFFLPSPSPRASKSKVESELVDDLLKNEVDQVVERLLSSIEPGGCRDNGDSEFGKGRQVPEVNRREWRFAGDEDQILSLRDGTPGRMVHQDRVDAVCDRGGCAQ